MLKLRQGGSKSAGRYPAKDGRVIKERQIRIKNLLTEKMMKSIICDHNGGARNLESFKDFKTNKINMKQLKKPLGPQEYSKVRNIIENEIDSYFNDEKSLGYSQITVIKNRALLKYYKGNQSCDDLRQNRSKLDNLRNNNNPDSPEGQKMATLLKDSNSQLPKKDFSHRDVGKIPDINKLKSQNAKSHLSKRTRNNKYGYFKSSNTVSDRSTIVSRKGFNMKDDNAYGDNKLKAISSMNNSYDCGRNTSKLANLNARHTYYNAEDSWDRIVEYNIRKEKSQISREKEEKRK
ncbi:unnamed protein product [Moneuplotes crassus]|uniref:Uncharacterized protein n=1 Tax=Euplotes crassus TaxID=5936 RepID=A0AAD1X3A0_EUPCR|nr:unnamed protein product [Moneuplotes crassus]